MTAEIIKFPGKRVATIPAAPKSSKGAFISMVTQVMNETGQSEAIAEAVSRQHTDTDGQQRSLQEIAQRDGNFDRVREILRYAI